MDWEVRAPPSTTENEMQVRLLPKSHKGKNRLIEAGKAMPEWNWTWDVVKEADHIAAKDGGPVLFVAPAGQDDDNQQRFSRWVHATADQDFTVHAL